MNITLGRSTKKQLYDEVNRVASAVNELQNAEGVPGARGSITYKYQHKYANLVANNNYDIISTLLIPAVQDFPMRKYDWVIDEVGHTFMIAEVDSTGLLGKMKYLFSTSGPVGPQGGKGDTGATGADGADGTTIKIGGVVKSEIDILNRIYPPGSVYMSIINISPSSFLGGAWSKLTSDAYLKIVTSNADAGISQGTAYDHKIPIRSIPSHGRHLYDYDGWNGMGIETGASSENKNKGRYMNAATVSSYGTTPKGWDIAVGNEMYPTGKNIGSGNAYYPYYYGVFVWMRTA